MDLNLGRDKENLRRLNFLALVVQVHGNLIT